MLLTGELRRFFEKAAAAHEKERAAIVPQYAAELLAERPDASKIVKLADRLNVSRARLRLHSHVADLLRDGFKVNALKATLPWLHDPAAKFEDDLDVFQHNFPGVIDSVIRTLRVEQNEERQRLRDAF